MISSLRGSADKRFFERIADSRILSVTHKPCESVELATAADQNRAMTIGLQNPSRPCALARNDSAYLLRLVTLTKEEGRSPGLRPMMQ